MSAFNKMLNSQGGNFDKLTKNLTDNVKKKSYKDDRLWALTRDDQNNGFAIIRFLPPSENSEQSFVTMVNHFFKGPGGIYSENSLTTLGQTDPVKEMVDKLWSAANEGDEEAKKQAIARKLQTNFYSNILVIKDKAKPENEGKVFLYRFGITIMDMLMDQMIPDEDEGEEGVNIYDFHNGANFKIKTRDKGGWVNYDKSSFAAPAPLFGGDAEKLEALWNKQYNLDAIVSEDKFKSYLELKTKLNTVLGVNDSAGNSAFEKGRDDSALEDKKADPVDDEDEEDIAGFGDDDDDNDAFFNNMTNDDDDDEIPF